MARASENRLELSERSLIADIRAELENWSEGAPPALEQLMSPLRQLLHFDAVVTLGVSWRGPDLTSAFLHGEGFDVTEFQRRFDAFLVGKGAAWTAWNPILPLARDRNRALSVLTTLGRDAFEQVPVYQQVIAPTSPLRGKDQLRMLVCDGPRVLAWIGGFLPVVSAKQTRMLQSLAPALARRLVFERKVHTRTLQTALMAPALESVGAPAFLLKDDGTIAHANTAGRRLVDTRREVADTLCTIARGSPPADVGALMTRIRAAGMASHSLVIFPQQASGDLRPEIECRIHWGLTTRQAEVLGFLARGLGNRDIAAHLRCSEATIEFHVSNLLSKAGCATRAALALQAWTLARRFARQ